MMRSGFEFRAFVLSSALSCHILVLWRKPARGLKATTVEEAEAERAVQSVEMLKGKEESDLVRLKEWVRPVSLSKRACCNLLIRKPFKIIVPVLAPPHCRSFCTRWGTI